MRHFKDYNDVDEDAICEHYIQNEDRYCGDYKSQMSNEIIDDRQYTRSEIKQALEKLNTYRNER